MDDTQSVSYTHLTLPTIFRVIGSVVGGRFAISSDLTIGSLVGSAIRALRQASR